MRFLWLDSSTVIENILNVSQLKKNQKLFYCVIFLRSRRDGARSQGLSATGDILENSPSMKILGNLCGMCNSQVWVAQKV